MKMNKPGMVQKLPYYYLGGVAVFLLLFTLYKQAPQFRAALSKDSSFAAENTVVEYKAVQAFNTIDNKKDAYNGSETAWFGGDKSGALGLQFQNVTLPPSATIVSASLKFTSPADSWITQSSLIYGEKNDNPQLFSLRSLPNTRTLTAASVAYSDNVKWTRDTTYTLPAITPILSELFPSSATKNINIILLGNGQKFGRKFIYGTGNSNGPKLTLTYNTTVTVTATPTPIAVTATPVSTPKLTATPIPTTAASIPPATPPPSPSGTLSMAMGLWSPSKWDTCTKAEHDSFSVIGPDGKVYPTWHPPVMKRADGSTCTFGHEHGQDPSKVPNWAEVKAHYAHVLPDGTKDLAHAGIPFGYVNEQMDTWLTATDNTSMIMRHEDHVGHKIATATNFAISLNHADGTPSFSYPGVTCNYIVKVHQGVHSKDAFQNNLHEVLYNVHCSDGHQINLDTMGKFGAPGQFTRICDGEGDRSTVIKTGFTYSNPNFPSSTDPNNTRLITDRSCIEKYFLVAPPAFSSNPYEAWPVSMGLKTPQGQDIVNALNLLFDVEDSIRYYNPGHVDPNTGLVDNLGHMQDLCYENLNGRIFRGSICDGSTNFGSVKGITWDDPRAGFRGINRGTYFKPGGIANLNGPTDWYSDPFGNNAQTTAFPGSIHQYVSKQNMNYGVAAGAFEDANVINMTHDDGNGTVHAPN